MAKHPFYKIWLQYDPTGDETTWCQDKVNDDDFEYVSAEALKDAMDVVDELGKVLAGCAESLVITQEGITDSSYENAITALARADELKRKIG